MVLAAKTKENSMPEEAAILIAGLEILSNAGSIILCLWRSWMHLNLTQNHLSLFKTNQSY